MHLKWTYFVAFLFAALALRPAMAHLLELPNKIGLSAQDYFTVQGIYRGWALLGVVVFGALASTLVLAILLRRDRAPSAWAAVAFLCIVATQIVFWTVVYPTNQATRSWTVIPGDWLDLRMRWEYGHAASAGFNLIAVAAGLEMASRRGGRARRAARQATASHPPVFAERKIASMMRMFCTAFSSGNSTGLPVRIASENRSPWMAY